MSEVARETDCVSPRIAAQIEARRAGKRKLVRHGGALCCTCLAKPPISKQTRRCRDCHNAYQRKWKRDRTAELKRLKEGTRSP